MSILPGVLLSERRLYNTDRDYSYVCLVLYSNTERKDIYVYDVVMRTQNNLTCRYVSICVVAVV